MNLSSNDPVVFQQGVTRDLLPLFPGSLFCRLFIAYFAIGPKVLCIWDLVAWKNDLQFVLILVKFWVAVGGESWENLSCCWCWFLWNFELLLVVSLVKQPQACTRMDYDSDARVWQKDWMEVSTVDCWIVWTMINTCFKLWGTKAIFSIYQFTRVLHRRARIGHTHVSWICLTSTIDESWSNHHGLFGCLHHLEKCTMEWYKVVYAEQFGSCSWRILRYVFFIWRNLEESTERWFNLFTCSNAPLAKYKQDRQTEHVYRIPKHQYPNGITDWYRKKIYVKHR